MAREEIFDEQSQVEAPAPLIDIWLVIPSTISIALNPTTNTTAIMSGLTLNPTINTTTIMTISIFVVYCN